MIEEFFGTVVLALAALGLVVAFGLSLLVSCELLSSLFSWLSVPPVISWATLGALCGIVYGLIRGASLQGRPYPIKRYRVVLTLVVVALVLLSLASPAARSLLSL
jgi:hypothetical protein